MSLSVRQTPLHVHAGRGWGGRKTMTLGFLLLTCYFTDQALLYRRVLVVFRMKYFNLLCENVSLCILLSASLTCSQKANFLVYPILSMDNKVSSLMSLVSVCVIMKKFNTKHASVRQNSVLKTVNLSQHRLSFPVKLFSSSRDFCNTIPLEVKNIVYGTFFRDRFRLQFEVAFLFWTLTVCAVLFKVVHPRDQSRLHGDALSHHFHRFGGEILSMQP